MLVILRLLVKYSCTKNTGVSYYHGLLLGWNGFGGRPGMESAQHVMAPHGAGCYGQQVMG